MADAPDNLVLQHLRMIRAVAEETREEVRGLKRRVASIEKQVAGIRADFAAVRRPVGRT